MSYPLDLDEYSDFKLHAELMRREAARRAGQCDYCGRAPSTSPCKFPERHAAEAERTLPPVYFAVGAEVFQNRRGATAQLIATGINGAQAIAICEAMNARRQGAGLQSQDTKGETQ